MKILKSILSLLLVPVLGLNAQFQINLSNGCNAVNPLTKPIGWINTFEPSFIAEEKVNYIIEAAGVEANFQLRSGSVPNLHAASSDGNRYLVYPNHYLEKFGREGSYWSAYFLLAHEIGHHLKRHDFAETDPYRLKYNELDADVFAGAALRMLGASLKESKLAVESLDLPKKTSAWPSKSSRMEAMILGWNRQDQKLQGEEIEHPAKESYLELPKERSLTMMDYEHHDETAPVVYSTKPNKYAKMPQFPWPPPNPGCYLQKTLVRKLNTKATSLEEIDLRLSSALDQLKYRQRSYFQTPGGFALVTRMEQFEADGSIKNRFRWEDYPVNESIDGIWDYFKSFVMPNPGRFRMFVFVVTNDEVYVKSNGPSIGSQTFSGLANSGAPYISAAYASEAITSMHRLEALVYEFEAPQSTKKCRERCPAFLDIEDHLDRSGLSQLIGF